MFEMPFWPVLDTCNKMKEQSNESKDTSKLFDFCIRFGKYKGLQTFYPSHSMLSKIQPKGKDQIQSTANKTQPQGTQALAIRSFLKKWERLKSVLAQKGF